MLVMCDLGGGSDRDRPAGPPLAVYTAVYGIDCHACSVWHAGRLKIIMLSSDHASFLGPQILPCRGRGGRTTTSSSSCLALKAQAQRDTSN